MATHHDIEVENSSEEKTKRVLEVWQTETHTQKGKSWSTTTLKKLFEPHSKFFQMWNKIFIISCVVAVSLDPLFLYIPIVNEDNKCLVLDKKLKAIAFVSRSFTDWFYSVDILLQILVAILAKPPPPSAGKPGRALSLEKKKSTAFEHFFAIAKTYVAIAHQFLPSVFLVDILAVLPIPQVVIFSFLSKMRRTRSPKTRKFLNSLVLLQYVPRVLRIFLLCNDHHLIPRKAGIWIKSAFNFCLYILASHVLGALWYYFSILSEINCWRYAYQTDIAYENSGFDCNDPPILRNITLLNGLCPTNPPNPTLFDFGLFTKAFLSGMISSTDFPQKFLICFWWGLRNLSSLGQNLEPSNNAWENLFAVLISIIGLLLFLYLIGNLQTYLQFATQRAEEIRRRVKTKSLEVDLWLTQKGIPKKLKAGIMRKVEKRIEENKDVQVENILSLLPFKHEKFIKFYIRMATLKKVPLLQRMDERLLKVLCEYLEPMTYKENELIMKEGQPLDKMFLIRQGVVRTYRLHSIDNNTKIKMGNCKLLDEGDLYGEELLNHLSNFPSSTDSLPKSTRNVMSVQKVEVFALKANNLETVVTNYWWHFTKDKFLYQCFDEVQLELLKKHAYSAIARQIQRMRTQPKKKKPPKNNNKAT